MHRSRLSTLVIDCAEAEYQRSVDFWSGALGREAIPEEDPRYATLRGRIGGEGGPYVLVQRVPAEERAVHLGRGIPSAWFPSCAATSSRARRPGDAAPG